MWDETPLLSPAAGWVELDENGWDALAAWLAGPERVGRMPQDDSSRLVRVECETGGVVTRRDEPFTPADRASIEGSINDYLAFAGVPPRPAGFVWFLRLPANWPEGRDLRREIHRIISESPYPQCVGDRMPAECLGMMREAVGALYPPGAMPDAAPFAGPSSGDSGASRPPG